jgi:hypothetical protein
MPKECSHFLLLSGKWKRHQSTTTYQVTKLQYEPKMATYDLLIYNSPMHKNAYYINNSVTKKMYGTVTYALKFFIHNESNIADIEGARTNLLM